MKDIILSEIQSYIEEEIFLEKPKDKSLAHYASPIAFSLAKKYKKSPNAIAEELVLKFKDSEILEASAINGYLNFHLKNSFINRFATRALSLGINFASEASKKNETTLLEYISANPTGPLHIGHVRGAVYGDSLQTISNYLGYKMVTEYYINDAGNQIELLGTSISLRAKELLYEENVAYPEKYYRGEYIDDIAKKASDKFGKDIFYDDSLLMQLAEFGKDEVLKIIKSDLLSAGIVIEDWISEKSLYPELDETVKKLENSNQMYKEDDKVWIRSSIVGDEKDRVVVREDGNPTYLAGDIIYHNNKFKRGYKNYINIWGADHHGYIPRLKAAIHFLGYDENRLEVILMQMVSLLKDGQAYKMSKRAGNSILMSDVLEDIGKDAMRFMFINKKTDTPLEFDVDELKKEDSSNPIFYINYAHARVYQVFAKANKNFDDVRDVDFSSLNEDGINLAFEALILNDVLNEALQSRNLQKIPDYLKSLSSTFHKYYNENRVIGSENEEAQLKLFAIVALSIKTALNLIGIDAKEKMNNNLES